jgi:hypothetical protein
MDTTASCRVFCIRTCATPLRRRYFPFFNDHQPSDQPIDDDDDDFVFCCSEAGASRCARMQLRTPTIGLRTIASRRLTNSLFLWYLSFVRSIDRPFAVAKCF